MQNFKFEELNLKGAYLIDNFFSGDERGSFSKWFEKDIYTDAGIEFSLSETFCSVSSKNVIRGLHFQTKNPQAKLVYVVKGKVWDVIVDLRQNSPTYKKWISVELSYENHKALYIPREFAHGFVALEDNTIMFYQCDGAYNIETDSGILYNDPEIAINWPIDEYSAIHSVRDLHLMQFSDFEGFVFE